MRILQKMIFYFLHHKESKLKILEKIASKIQDDKKYLLLKWKIINFYGGDVINWENPKTFNEKLNWLKIYDRNPMYTAMADKLLAKEIVGKKIGNQHVARLYGVFNSFEEIDFEKLPQSFVLKCTHDSGSMIICKDKAVFDKTKAKNHLEKALKKNYYFKSREWPYKNIIPRILVEEYLDDHTGNELRDYKFWCFNGKPRVVYFTNKADSIYENYYDLDFKPLDISHGFPRHKPEFDRPELFDEMVSFSTILSQGLPFVRIDFFYINKKIYFAEFTFYDWGGFKPFTNKEWDIKLGSWINLPKELYSTQQTDLTKQ
jgi:hypothetical protein